MTQLADLFAQIKPDAWDVELTYPAGRFPEIIISTKSRMLPDGRMAVLYTTDDLKFLELLGFELRYGGKLDQARQTSLMEAIQ